MGRQIKTPQKKSQSLSAGEQRKCREIIDPLVKEFVAAKSRFSVSEAKYRADIRSALNVRLVGKSAKDRESALRARESARDEVSREFLQKFRDDAAGLVKEWQGRFDGAQRNARIDCGDVLRGREVFVVNDLNPPDIAGWVDSELKNISGPNVTESPVAANSPILSNSPIVSNSPVVSESPAVNANVNANIALTPQPTIASPRPAATATLVPELTPEVVTPPGPEFPILPVTLAVAAFLTAAAFLLTKLAKRLLERRRFGNNAGPNFKSLKRAIGVKNELTEKWLKKRASKRIHAIGVGLIDGTDEFCVQVFVDDSPGDLLEDPPTALLPARYRNLPVVVYEMPRAVFLSDEIGVARGEHRTLRGGISASNANLTSESGTIGYFFRPSFIDNALHVFTKNHVYLLSNAHVFADLTRDDKDESDLIMQPSPGEGASSRPVAELYEVHPIEFGGDVERPNFVDAAIARIMKGVGYECAIPQIGSIYGSVEKEAVLVRSLCRKFGRTTGLTSGRVFSIHLSIWVRYDARGAEAFFKDQFLIVPERGPSFVKPGDSGSLVVDDEARAIGLIFAGAGEKTALQFADVAEAMDLENLGREALPKIENYGVANAISDVMKAFRIKPESTQSEKE